MGEINFRNDKKIQLLCNPEFIFINSQKLEYNTVYFRLLEIF